MNINISIPESLQDKLIKILEGHSFSNRRNGLPFACPCDNGIESILSISKVKDALEVMVDKYYGYQLEDFKKEGVALTCGNYPRLYNTFEECCKRLNVQVLPKVILTKRLQGFNALSVGNDSNPMILLSMRSAVSLPEGELKFLLGHELGHILQKNMICHTVSGLLFNLKKKSEILGTMIADLIEMPLKEWCRNSEYTADRAGLLCCQDMNHVYSLMAKVKRYERKSMAPRLMELYKDHPFIDNRIKKVNEFYLTLHT